MRLPVHITHGQGGRVRSQGDKRKGEGQGCAGWRRALLHCEGRTEWRGWENPRFSIKRRRAERKLAHLPSLTIPLPPPTPHLPSSTPPLTSPVSNDKQTGLEHLSVTIDCGRGVSCPQGPLSDFPVDEGHFVAPLARGPPSAGRQTISARLLIFFLLIRNHGV